MSQQNESTIQPEALPRRFNSIVSMLPGSMQKRVRAFAVNLRDTFFPESVDIRPLPGEETLLTIHLAWYRDIIGLLVFKYFRLLLGLALVTAVAMAAFGFFSPFNIAYAIIPLGVLLVILIAGVYERFEYRQYRLLKTNKRLVISIPQKNSWPLVDNIELAGAPKIIDTNWSPNGLWRIFQFFTGARDLYLSMSGLQFTEGQAKVRDALIIPDVMPDDIFELKKLVFNAG